MSDKGQQLDNILKPLIGLPEESGGCWRWLGKINKETGYGHKQSGGRTLLAHRWVYQIFKGWIPKDRHIDHLCRNRWCVNPEHLEAVSQAVNSRRGIGTKLTREQVVEIKGLLKGIKWGQKKHLAKRFGVSEQLLSDIKYGRAWADIQ